MSFNLKVSKIFGGKNIVGTQGKRETFSDIDELRNKTSDAVLISVRQLKSSDSTKVPAFKKQKTSKQKTSSKKSVRSKKPVPENAYPTYTDENIQKKILKAFTDTFKDLSLQTGNKGIRLAEKNIRQNLKNEGLFEPYNRNNKIFNINLKKLVDNGFLLKEQRRRNCYYMLPSPSLNLSQPKPFASDSTSDEASLTSSASSFGTEKVKCQLPKFFDDRDLPPQSFQDDMLLIQPQYPEDAVLREHQADSNPAKKSPIKRMSSFEFENELDSLFPKESGFSPCSFAHPDRRCSKRLKPSFSTTSKGLKENQKKIESGSPLLNKRSEDFNLPLPPLTLVQENILRLSESLPSRNIDGNDWLNSTGVGKQEVFPSLNSNQQQDTPLIGDLPSSFDSGVELDTLSSEKEGSNLPLSSTSLEEILTHIRLERV